MCVSDPVMQRELLARASPVGHCKFGDPGRPAPQSSLSRAHAHLIAHATIVPSPYQDSLRRDGGQARWELGTRHHCCLSVRFRKCQVAFPWARTSTRIQGVVNRRCRGSESIAGN